MADREILPNFFIPYHYKLVITDLEFETWTYKGTVTIVGDLAEPTRSITLNVLALELLQARVTTVSGPGEQVWETTDFRIDSKTQRALLTFDGELSVSQKASLSVEFTGVLNQDMAGFYRSQYKPAAPPAKSVPSDSQGQFCYMFSTQFEACDARRAFPCFDEPNLKATFEFAIEIPDDQVALSNMPVASEEAVEGKTGTKLVVFEKSPAMSTYLYAWAVGDFEYIEALTARRYAGGKACPVRVYTTRGLVEQGRWALDHAPRVLDFFSESFKVDYPLPKSDILAVHEFTHRAMENWGLVTYRDTAILFDDGRSEARFKYEIAYVVGHELAHQWFGNLVTMDWWNDLWLNEGFATWAGYLAVDHMHPDYDVWSDFVSADMQQAFQLDGLRASHPISVPVRDAFEINQVFDKISYRKGCSIIRMLAAHLGINTFLKGVAIYLQKHAYANATTADLWKSLSEASGQDVESIMDSWTTKMGYPLLTVEEARPGQISVRQSRFLSTGDVKPEDDTTTWWLPLAIQGKAGARGIQPLSIATKQAVIGPVNDDFYLINSCATGFYRVKYPHARRTALSTQLDRLSVQDKTYMITSASALAFSGDADTPGLLTLIRSMKNETHYHVLSTALEAVGTVKSVFGDDEAIRLALETLTRDLIAKAWQQLGWEPVEGEDFHTSLLRRTVLLAAVASDGETVTSEAARRFDNYTACRADHGIHADLRLPVFCAAIKANPERAVPLIKQEWFNTTAVDGKQICLKALGSATSPSVLKRDILPFLLNASPPALPQDACPPADVHYLVSSLASNRAARGLLWKTMRDEWPTVLAKLGGNMVVLDRMVQVGLAQFSDLNTLGEVETFFAGANTRGFDRTLGAVVDGIRARAAYRTREGEQLRGWLISEGVAGGTNRPVL